MDTINTQFANIMALEKHNHDLQMALKVAKEALEMCSAASNSNDDEVRLKTVKNALAYIFEIEKICAETAETQPTNMGLEQAKNWAWKQLRHDLDDSHWKVGETGTFFGFFLHGWNHRGQYELQRRAALNSEN